MAPSVAPTWCSSSSVLVTACTVQGMAPYPGQVRGLALGFWPECFRRLDVKGGRRSFPKETRSALDIEGKHVTLQGPPPALSPASPFAPSTGRQDLQIRRHRQVVQDCPGMAIAWTDIPALSARDRGRPPVWQQCWQQSSRYVVLTAADPPGWERARPSRSRC